MDLPAWIFVFLPVVLDRLVEMWRLGFLGSINKYNSFGMHIGHIFKAIIIIHHNEKP